MLLLLCSLSSSKKSFRATIVYGGKSNVKVNEVMKHLLNKDKIGNQLMIESYHDDFEQVHFSKEKSNNESFTSDSRHKNLVCNWCHKKEHIRADCWTRKKKQEASPVNWLKRMKTSVTFYLSQTDQSIIKIDELLTLDVHIISVPIERCSPHTLWFKEERSSWGTLLQTR